MAKCDSFSNFNLCWESYYWKIISPEAHTVKSDSRFVLFTTISTKLVESIFPCLCCLLPSNLKRTKPTTDSSTNLQFCNSSTISNSPPWCIFHCKTKLFISEYLFKYASACQSLAFWCLMPHWHYNQCCNSQELESSQAVTRRHVECRPLREVLEPYSVLEGQKSTKLNRYQIINTNIDRFLKKDNNGKQKKTCFLIFLLSTPNEDTQTKKSITSSHAITCMHPQVNLCLLVSPTCLFQSAEGFFNERAVLQLMKSFKFQMHEVIMPVN